MEKRRETPEPGLAEEPVPVWPTAEVLRLEAEAQASERLLRERIRQSAKALYLDLVCLLEQVDYHAYREHDVREASRWPDDVLRAHVLLLAYEYRMRTGQIPASIPPASATHPAGASP